MLITTWLLITACISVPRVLIPSSGFWNTKNACGGCAQARTQAGKIPYTWKGKKKKRSILVLAGHGGNAFNYSTQEAKAGRFL